MAPRVDMAATVGETPLTIGWIEHMIVKQQQDTEATLVDWSAEIIGVGQGFASHIFRVRLVWSEKGKKNCSLPSSVIVKVPTLAKISKGMDDVSKDGNMEMKLEEDVMATFFIQAHANEVGSLKYLNRCEKPPLKVPKFYIAQDFKVDVPGHGCLVIQDFTNGAPPSLVDGLSKKQLYQVAKSLAEIHAFTWNDNEMLNTFRPVPEDILKSFFEMSEGLGEQLTKMFPFLECDFVDLYNKGRWIFEMDVARSILQYGKRNGLPEVLAHGDLWACNMLVQKDDNGKPTGDLLTLIDWQTAHPGFVIEDIARVLVTSVKGEMRRKETDGVLQYYFDELRANLAKYGKECSITLAMIRDAYEFNFPYAAAFFLWGVPLMATGATHLDENGKLLDSFANEISMRSKLLFEDVIELKDKNLW